MATRDKRDIKKARKRTKVLMEADWREFEKNKEQVERALVLNRIRLENIKGLLYGKKTRPYIFKQILTSDVTKETILAYLHIKDIKALKMVCKSFSKLDESLARRFRPYQRARYFLSVKEWDFYPIFDDSDALFYRFYDIGKVSEINLKYCSRSLLEWEKGLKERIQTFEDFLASDIEKQVKFSDSILH